MFHSAGPSTGLDRPDKDTLLQGRLWWPVTQRAVDRRMTESVLCGHYATGRLFVVRITRITVVVVVVGIRFIPTCARALSLSYTYEVRTRHSVAKDYGVLLRFSLGFV